jgi:hypothetical protein
LNFNRSNLGQDFLTREEQLDIESGEGAYIFLPQWDNPLPKNFGNLLKNITYQKGELVE